jgi:hypothetical protein
MSETKKYYKHIDNGTTFNEGTVKCDQADIAATGSLLSAPTYTAVAIECTASAVVLSTGSATVVIDKLTADTVKLTCHSSATLRIKYIKAKTITIDALDSANLRMESGECETIAGNVNNSSYSCFAGKITVKDDVTAEHASTWSVGRCL